MIPLLLILAAAQDTPPQTPIDAERAFAEDAKKLGQWTAFRKWSTDDAVMFTPQPTNAHDFVKDRKDPPQAIDWWPTASYISCDGVLAINKGGWKRPDGSVGYFTTVWQRQGDGGWKWIVDSGDHLKALPERPAAPKIIRAPCTTEFKGEFVVDDVMAIKEAEGGSPDQTLHWRWRMADDGGRTLVAWFYDGAKLKPIFTDKIPAPSK